MAVVIDQPILTEVPPAPRALPKRFAFQRAPALLIVGILLVAISIPLAIVFGVTGLLTPPFDDWKIDAQHITTTAVVTECKVLKHTHINGRHPVRISFQLKPDGGPTITATGHTLDATAYHLAPDDRIQVEYDPDTPRLARPVGGTVAALPPLIFFTMLSFVAIDPAIGMVCLIIAARRVRRDGALYTRGDVAMTELASVRKVTHIRMGSNSPYDVRYQFRDALDNLVNGRDRTYRYAWGERLAAGQQVAILYDPRRPSHNMLYLPAADPQ